MGCLNATATQKQTGVTVNLTHKATSVTASAVQKQTGVTVNLTYKATGITASAVQTCEVFIGFPLYVADGRLYAADAALYVDKY